MGQWKMPGLELMPAKRLCRCRPAFIAALAMLVVGCGHPRWLHKSFKVGPDYACPSVPIAENWIDSDDERVIPCPSDCRDWWTVFQDPVLDALIDTAYRQNLSLREAGLRVLEARAERAIATGNLFPQAQQIDGSFTREQLGTVGQPALLPAPDYKRSFNTWSLGGNLSWELDLWGRFRRAVEAADANLQASVYDYQAILVSLIAEVVTAYIDIRAYEQRLEYARLNVRIQESSLELAKARVEEGKTSKISVHLSNSNVQATRASITSLEIGLRQASNRLCSLLGMPPLDRRILVPEDGAIPAAPAEVVVGIPADLLRRRPDVRAAERRVAAQSARVGIAAADLYPRIAVTGKISVQAEEFRDLFTSQAQGGSIGPSFEWDVLNYGRIRNNVRAQEARLEQLVVSYQDTVLTANREVEDGLVAFLQNQRRVQSLAATVRETQRALELELIRFKEGESDFTGVFVLQGDLVGKQDQWALAQGEVATSLVAVYKALGGGWDVRGQPLELIETVAGP